MQRPGGSPTEVGERRVEHLHVDLADVAKREPHSSRRKR
jgi:hypothetical protein